MTSDDEFEIARRAVERGLRRQDEVEAAILRRDREPGARLLEILRIPADAARELASSHSRPVPPEAAAAMQTPVNRVGRYWKVVRLSEGGMGDVWLGWDGALARWVALKFLKRAEDERARAFFSREAALAASLDHPGIARIYEVGETDGAPWLAMQYVEGRTLDRAALSARPRDIARWVRDAALAVAAAHRAGVIHRDLKPNNAMLDAAQHVVLLDFGLAKDTRAEVLPLATAATPGTPNYMAPEQVRGEATPLSDVYGLGAMLYDLVVGRPPFVGATPGEVLAQVLDSDPVRPRAMLPDFSVDLEAIILACLEKEPSRRPPSAEAVAADLDAYLAGEPLRHSRRRTAAYVLARRIRRQPLLWSLGAASALLAASLAAGAWIAWTRGGTLRLDGLPEGAIVQVAGKRHATGARPLVFPLAAGDWRVAVEADGFESDEFFVSLARGETRGLQIALKRHQGMLEVEAEPRDALVEAGGRTHGSRVFAFALEAGRHAVRARAEGCFDREADAHIRRGETARVSLALDRGELWRYRSSGLQSGAKVAALPDLDGDGEPELAAGELRDLLVLSGSDGRVLRRERVSDDALWAFEVMGGGTMLAAWSEGQTGLRLTTIPLEPDGVARRWEGPPRSLDGSRCPAACAAGLRIALAGRGGDAFSVDPTGGAALRVALDATLEQAHLLATTAGGVLLFAGDSQGGSLAGAVDPSGAPRWSRRFERARFLWCPGPPAALVVLAGTRWEALEAATGSRLGGATLPAAGGECLLNDLDNDGRIDGAFLAGGQLAAYPLTGDIPMWTRAAPGAAWLTRLARGPLVWGSADGVVAVDPALGGDLWCVAAPPERLLAADLDRDGRDECLAGFAGGEVVCFEAAGTRRWTLRLPTGSVPLAAVPAGEEPRLAVGRGGAWVGLSRTPRVLWSARAAGPLLASPLVGRDASGASHVVQAGDWGHNAHLRALDGRTGARLWDFAEKIAPNGPPCAADLDGDGIPELFAYWPGGPAPDSSTAAALRLSDGTFRTRVAVSPVGDFYATPLAADLDGDGAPDLVAGRRSTRDAVAVDLRRGRILWKRDLAEECWSGAAAADADGDGLPDVLVATRPGPLRALRGADGRTIWEAPLGAAGAVATPCVLAGEIWICDATGRLRVLDLRTGLDLRAASGTFAASTAVVPAGKDVVLGVAGDRGLVALRATDLREIWAYAAPLDAEPAVADLDGDGTLEVMVATRAGRLDVLDAENGRRLWGVALAADGFESPPAVADLDGDGVLDLLASNPGGRLFAVSGRPTLASRK